MQTFGCTSESSLSLFKFHMFYSILLDIMKKKSEIGMFTKLNFGQFKMDALVKASLVSLE